MDNYPPGVNSGTRNAPWNQPPAPECDCCQNVIHDPSDHQKSCELLGIGSDELREQGAEDRKVEQAEMRMDEMRIQEHKK
jgi:hypothetical protein